MSEPGEPLIVAVISHYHPTWEAPADNGRDWIPTRCPFHGDERASAAVSYRFNAYKCQACPVKGDAIGLLRAQEGVTYHRAVELAEELSPGSSEALSQRATRVARRGVPGNPRSDRTVDHRGRQAVSPGVRGRPRPGA
ncbi:CHC2 zinc finger domain-containing protein [Mycolicibacterium houstonense]|uniref:CHC2 zinc finger domain-containing protein n=1 Tax=Mycolicibacterium houstonense TaxID=146021 RepID=UPI00093E86F3